MNANNVVLSLISHTNVGKTALARTLLRQDVGEMEDREHVTLVSEAYTMIECDDCVMRLWDTPVSQARYEKSSRNDSTRVKIQLDGFYTKYGIA